MKKVVILFISLALLLPSLVHGEEVASEDWIIENGYFGRGGLRLDEKISRAELATVIVRLLDLNPKENYKSNFKDIEGWAAPYIALVEEREIMAGVSKDKFNPSGNVTYTELVTVFMRTLGYKDGVDFYTYPTDYQNKALEIGLADMYIDGNEKVTRAIVLDTMIKTLNANLKSSEVSLFNTLHSKPKVEKTEEDVEVKNLVFNTVVSGVFKGELAGRDDFTGYKVVLLTKNGAVYEQNTLGKSGKFSIDGFDISLMGKLSGYKYEVYDNEGSLILEDELK